ncbi:hypothetical protein EVAR_13589_1 [Eumeta japonica]|uniref:Uncharacterized protein n=1 Tax=Eumeta variegata TaxID=151549 RepID=A0A4C1U930_EUMVA|nr:hypothetical protein EVAR_13589_1 [Eumeta japonica]
MQNKSAVTLIVFCRRQPCCTPQTSGCSLHCVRIARHIEEVAEVACIPLHILPHHTFDAVEVWANRSVSFKVNQHKTSSAASSCNRSSVRFLTLTLLSRTISGLGGFSRSGTKSHPLDYL